MLGLSLECNRPRWKVGTELRVQQAQLEDWD